jgi:hypothetical protein
MDKKILAYAVLATGLLASSAAVADTAAQPANNPANGSISVTDTQQMTRAKRGAAQYEQTGGAARKKAAKSKRRKKKKQAKKKKAKKRRRR